MSYRIALSILALLLIVGSISAIWPRRAAEEEEEGGTIVYGNDGLDGPEGFEDIDDNECTNAGTVDGPAASLTSGEPDADCDANNGECTAADTPWACCTGSGTGDCELAGDESHFLGSCAHRWDIIQTRWRSTWTTDGQGITSGVITFKFLWQPVYMGDDPAHCFFEMMQTLFDTSPDGFDIYVDCDDLKLTIRNDVQDAAVSDTAFVVGTTYKMCVEHNCDTDQTTLYQDAEGGDYCDTQVAQTITSVGDCDSVNGHDFMSQFATDDTCTDFVFDDVLVTIPAE